MRWRVEFGRKSTATKAGQVARAFAVEVTARSNEEAIQAAKQQAAREGRGHVFDVLKVRKI